LAAHAATQHHAFVYAGRKQFVDGVTSFIREGIACGAHVVVALPDEKHRWVRHELGRVGDAVESVDPAQLYARHGPMFHAIFELLVRHGSPDGPGLRLVAEQPLGDRRRGDVCAYLRYEAAANAAYRDFNARILCPYDARLPDAILEPVRQTHPQTWQPDSSQPNARFEDPREFVRRFVSDRRGEAEDEVRVQPLEQREDVGRARALARERAVAAGLAADAVEDLVMAVSEVVANAFLHGAAPRSLCSYEEAEHLVVRVRDAGEGPADPLVGYLPPDSESPGGRGLWLAHQLCDIVEVVHHERHTDVYLQMRLAA
jgi:anti-sigma regulatory factor (Ser/Thr protein kinase)